MSTATPEQRRQRYLAKVFALNPLWQTPEILELRRKALGLTPTEAAIPTRVQPRREDSSKVRERIKQIQDEFWSMPLDALKSELAGLGAAPFPELRPIIQRLLTIASCRGAFPQLAREKRMELPLFNAFKTAVVLPPTDAGYAKEKFIYSLRDAAQLKRTKKSVALIRDKFPVLYAFEKDWFETILKLTKPRSEPTTSQYQPVTTDDGPTLGWGAWIGIIIVVRIVLRFISQ